MKIFIIYALITMFLLACTCSGIAGFYYAKKEQVRPIVIELDGHKANLYEVLNKVNIYPTDYQKEQIPKIVTDYNKKPMGFK